MSNNKEVEKFILQLIKKGSPYKGEIKDSQDFFYDLAYDSLSFYQLIVDIEQQYKVFINENDVESGINTPKKLIDLVCRKLASV